VNTTITNGTISNRHSDSIIVDVCDNEDHSQKISVQQMPSKPRLTEYSSIIVDNSPYISSFSTSHPYISSVSAGIDIPIVTSSTQNSYTSSYNSDSNYVESMDGPLNSYTISLPSTGYTTSGSTLSDDTYTSSTSETSDAYCFAS